MPVRTSRYALFVCSYVLTALTSFSQIIPNPLLPRDTEGTTGLIVNQNGGVNNGAVGIVHGPLGTNGFNALHGVFHAQNAGGGINWSQFDDFRSDVYPAATYLTGSPSAGSINWGRPLDTNGGLFSYVTDTNGFIVPDLPVHSGSGQTDPGEQSNYKLLFKATVDPDLLAFMQTNAFVIDIQSHNLSGYGQPRIAYLVNASGQEALYPVSAESDTISKVIVGGTNDSYSVAITLVNIPDPRQHPVFTFIGGPGTTLSLTVTGLIHGTTNDLLSGINGSGTWLTNQSFIATGDVNTLVVTATNEQESFAVQAVE